MGWQGAVFLNEVALQHSARRNDVLADHYLLQQRGAALNGPSWSGSHPSCALQGSCTGISRRPAAGATLGLRMDWQW
jgi:hypothetical protein